MKTPDNIDESLPLLLRIMAKSLGLIPLRFNLIENGLSWEVTL